MVDEIYDRTYLGGRQQLHAGIDRGLEKLGRSVATTFKALHEIQFAAPWTRRPRDTGCA